ncbi:Gfo/Idh/MocA family protein [Terriglobus sp. ADX1]|uniref:Gfo/Idh/MocA family protein n=1 Tax=Terriglobus sp. ADX1 TaxID=2794063 RepID=UPI002FE66CF8
MSESLPPIDSSRRDFLRLGTATTVGLALATQLHAAPVTNAQTMINVPFAKSNARIAIVGLGGRGTSLLKNLVATDAEIVALCDIVESKVRAAQQIANKAGKGTPEIFYGNDHSYEKMMKRTDIDLVIVSTSWAWHAPISIAAMESGKHAAMEVPGVTTIEDCWKVIDTSERTRRHCMILENCCYGYNETLILRMAHAGALGELLYGEGAYLHDLREILFANQSEGLWRREDHTKRDGNLYPTHGLGPIANCMQVQRGDRFHHLVSMSTMQRGLEIYRKEHIPANDPKWKEKYVCGDMNVSMIKTEKGRTITVKHDVVNPRPYSRVNMLAGTKGVFEDYPPRIYVEGQKGGEAYGTLDAWKQYEHPLWSKEGDAARKSGGHGGMDYIMLYRIVQCLKQGLVPDMDVYDCAAWGCIYPLSVQSVARGSAPVDVPDFTRGKWQMRTASQIATYS